MRLFQPVVEEDNVAPGTNADVRKLSTARRAPGSGRRDASEHARSSSTARPRRHASEDESQGSNEELREPQAVRDIQETEEQTEPPKWIDEEVRSRLERMEAQQQRLEELLMELAGAAGRAR